MLKVDLIIGNSLSDLLRAAILEAAGDEVKVAYENELKNHPNSLLISTPPGQLVCKRIFFVRWKPNGDEAEIRKSIADYISNVIRNAALSKFTSIAFPSIGCGLLFHDDKHVVVETMVNEIKQQLKRKKLPWTIKFIVLPADEEVFTEFCKAVWASNAGKNSFSVFHLNHSIDVMTEI